MAEPTAESASPKELLPVQEAPAKELLPEAAKRAPALEDAAGKGPRPEATKSASPLEDAAARKVVPPELESEEEEPPELNKDVLAVIIARLPTKEAYKCAVVCKPIREHLRGPLFLKRHFAPRPPCVDEIAGGFVIQPAVQGAGYTHLTVIDSSFPNKYRAPTVRTPDHDEFDVDVYSTTPPPCFFERSVRDIDVCVVASHGHLLLGRSPACYFVCCPEEDRWLRIPIPDTAEETGKTAAGLQYHVDAASGDLHFTVAVLARLGNTFVGIHTFTSSEPSWVGRAVEHEAAAACLAGGVGPGICTAGAFFWKSRVSGAVISFDGNNLFVVAEPPPPEGHARRVGSSLGSAGGRLRLCAVDVGAEEAYGAELLALDGVLSVWVREHDAGAWTRVKNVVIADVHWYYHYFRGFEFPYDFGGASSGSVILKKNGKLYLRDLDTGEMQLLSSLYADVCPLTSSLYDAAFDVFPVYL